MPITTPYASVGAECPYKLGGGWGCWKLKVLV